VPVNFHPRVQTAHLHSAYVWRIFKM
jgi:hypothetical protein